MQRTPSFCQNLRVSDGVHTEDCLDLTIQFILMTLVVRKKLLIFTAR